METYFGYALMVLGIGIAGYGKYRYSEARKTGRTRGVELFLCIAVAAVLAAVGYDLSRDTRKDCVSDGVRTVCVTKSKG